MEQCNHSGKTVVGVLLCVVIGTILGVLYAPMKGSDTRNKILSKRDDFTSSMKNRFDGFVADIKKEYETFKGKAKDFVDEKLS
jgi:gas vesicle protein